MAILRVKEILDMDYKTFRKRLMDLRSELAKERANIGIKGAPDNPGRIRELKRTIARMLTLEEKIKVRTKK
jgi:large subunit ribosomal protein L29